MGPSLRKTLLDFCRRLGVEDQVFTLTDLSAVPSGPSVESWVLKVLDLLASAEKIVVTGKRTAASPPPDDRSMCWFAGVRQLSRMFERFVEQSRGWLVNPRQLK